VRVASCEADMCALAAALFKTMIAELLEAEKAQKAAAAGEGPEKPKQKMQ
jgi:hypothetical protein